MAEYVALPREDSSKNLSKDNMQVRCVFCFQTKRVCGKKSPDGEYLCSREEGHTGIHVACGVMFHAIAEWEP